MLSPLNLLCRTLLTAFAASCIGFSAGQNAFAQDAQANDNAGKPAASPADAELKANPNDKPSDKAKSLEEPPQAPEGAKGSESEKQTEEKLAKKPDDQPADNKNGEADEKKKAEDEKKKAENETKRPEMEAKDTKPNEPTKDGSQTESSPERPKTPRRIHGLGSFDGVQLRNQPWKIHDIRRPHPPVVTPGELSTYDKPGTAPSDAIVLFDGKNLSQWAHLDRELPNELIEAQWKVQDGYFEVTPGFGSLQTLEGFGSCHLHLEWQAPAQVRGDGQNRGNSGIKFMSSFEVQILDSFNNRTYADGQAGAIYGQYPPMVNASRKPGEWQVYDILFIAPKFSLDGKLIRPASATVMHNGIFIQNAREYAGPSGAHGAMYSPLTPAAPIMLQDHGSPVRFRNIWVRNIPDVE